jgi:hypothetical protein
MPKKLSAVQSTTRLAIVVVAAVIAGIGAHAALRQRLSALVPLDSAGRVTYFVAEGTPGSQYQPADNELAVWALKAWEQSAGGRLRFEASREQDALVRVHWVNAQDGLYGEMRPLFVNGRRGAEVFVRPDTEGLGGEIARLARTDPLMRDTIVYLTCVHELGHALGLEHTSDFDDIMYFFGFGGDIPGFFKRYRAQLKQRADIPMVSGLSAGDIERISGLYGTGR